jgi:uroporphyrinogen III methyltransferase/synthase
LGAGCVVPVGAYAEHREGEIRLLAMLASLDGERIVTVEERLDLGREEAQAAEIAARMLRDTGGESARRSWNGSHGVASGLRGARVVVTRPRAQAGPLIRELSERGAEVIALPTIRIAPMADPSALDAQLSAAAAGQFDWIVFTSVNAVATVADRLHAIGIEPNRLLSLSVAAVGPATARAAAGIGLVADIVPFDSTADGLARALEVRVQSGDRVLFPRSAIGRQTIPQALRRCGADVVDLVAYETVAEPDIAQSALARVRHRAFDVVTFASPSSVRQLIQLLGDERELVAGTPAVCIGPASALAAAEAGFEVVGIAEDSGPETFSDVVADYWNGAQGRMAREEWTRYGETAIANRSGV